MFYSHGCKLPKVPENPIECVRGCHVYNFVHIYSFVNMPSAAKYTCVYIADIVCNIDLIESIASFSKQSDEVSQPATVRLTSPSFGFKFMSKCADYAGFSDS